MSLPVSQNLVKNVIVIDVLIMQNSFTHVIQQSVTANPPTQGRRKITVRVGNITRRVNSLYFIQRSQSHAASHCFACIHSHYQTPTDSDPLWLSQ